MRPEDEREGRVAPHRFLGQEARVGSAEDDGDSPRAHGIPDGVGARSGGSDRRNADEVSRDLPREKLARFHEQGLSGINWTFLTSFPSATPSKAGIYPVILGSIYLVGLTLVFAVPMGVGAAIYLNEFAKDNRYTRFLRRIIQNLAGVPSIVFGLVGLAVFSRLFGFGPSLLAGSLTLAIMILPVIVVATEEALKSVPDSFREASRGLGSTKWQTVRHHVLPYAVPGTLTGIILALSRAIGETAPILFIGSLFAKTAPSSILDGFLALPITIFYWTRHPKLQFHDLAASTIVVLLVILLSMNLVAIIIRQRSQSRRDW